MCPLLATDTTVRTLHLDGNGIGQRGMAHVAEMIECNRTLLELTLSYNSFKAGFGGLRPKDPQEPLAPGEEWTPAPGPEKLLGQV